MTIGTEVTVTASRLGLFLDPDCTMYQPDIYAEAGDRGRYLKTAPALGLDKSWHVITVRNLFCPAHRTMFRANNETRGEG